MAQCFTEAKPFSPSPLHMYGRAYSEQFYSSEHGNGSLDHVQVYNQGYNPRESSRKEGGLIRGYGSFGMPGAYKVNKEICHGRGDTGSHMKSSIKEEQSVTGGSKEYLNGGSRAPNFDPNGIPTLLHSPHSYMQAEGRSSLEGALTIHSKFVADCYKVEDCKSGIPGSLAGRCLSRGGLVETVPNLSCSSQSPNSARRSLDRSQLRDDSQQGNIASANNASGNGSEKGSAILWNESTGSSIVKGSPNTDRLSSGKLVIGSNLKVGDIPKPNQPSRGGFVRDNSLSESSAGGRIYSMDVTRGIATQVTAGSAEGAVLAATSKPGNENATADNGGIAGPASAGENMNPLGRRRELLSQKTPAQSWPNSPANLRSVPRTRNLSEGSFNLIFPVGDFEKSMGGTRSNAGSPSRSSPRSWSTGADDSSSTAALRSSSDGYLLGMMYSPVNALGTVTRTKPNVEDSNELGSAGLHSPVKDPLLERATSNNERFSHGRQSSNDRGCISTTNMKPSENLGQKSMALSSEKNITQSLHATSPQSATYSSKFGTSATAKFSNSEHQNRSASDTCITQTVCSVPGMTVLSHSRDKSFNHGIIIGGSFGRTLSPSPGVTIPNTVTVEGMAPPAFGNITKGSPNGTMPTIVTSSFGNIIKENSKSDLKKPYPQTNQADESFLLKRALSSKDPEEVKNYGNDQYKKGRYSEALLLYERAIILLPGQALFHSNRAAALAAVGRIGDAVQDCQEAIKLDPLYGRAHQRLASLLLRLGRVEDARWHLKAAGSLSDQRDIQRSDVILKHVAKCLEARMARDWASVIRESDATVVAGADSASKAFALKAEALLHIGQTDEATRVISAAQKVESSLKRNTTLAESIVQVVQAKIDLALGKFQEAIVAAEKAVQIDSNNLEAAVVLQKARAIGRSRTMGNELYKAGKFFDASAAYGEGLEHDPANAILLCNRAACRSNLGLWESAIEDCDAALTAQPNYIKARLRRAHCFAKLEHWEEALADYEMLRRELPGDIEVARALFDVQAALEKSRGEESFKKSFGEGIDKVSSTNQFRAAVTSPGLAVVHFNSEDNVRCRQLSAFVIQLRKRHPAVNFVKVDVDENRQLAKLENVTTVPTFQLYRNGLKVKELEGPSYETLEQAIQLSIL